TRVLPARLYGQRLRQSDHGETRAAVEVTLLSLGPSGHWRALAKPARRVAVGEKLIFAEGLSARVVAKKHAGLTLSFNRKGAAFDGALAAAGSMPLPPYIASRRAADAADLDDYQTVFAARPGAVAAPTASLHFDKPLLAALETQGISFSKVTLHVGAGTFLPVKADDIREHKMHAEWGEITAPAAAAIAATRAGGGRIIPVGTTALRLLETAARDGGGTVRPWVGETDIFITPGFDFQATDGLITNFHLPKSTLMMLVSALMGIDRIRSIYAHAIASQYRFFSYGDGSLLLPGG
ncbi:MAG: tRNA preQ1(34) S-adenosylmethionine ribosyltransferase-isomerase QueA, partial [Pseudomonadota bacterium]